MINVIIFYSVVLLSVIYTIYLSSKILQAFISVFGQATERAKSIEHCTLALCREAEKKMKDKVQKC